jgi:hypothetical protein
MKVAVFIVSAFWIVIPLWALQQVVPILRKYAVIYSRGHVQLRFRGLQICFGIVGGVGRDCCTKATKIRGLSPIRKLARNGLVGSSVWMVGNTESGKGDPVKPPDRRSNPASDASSLSTCR